MQITIHLPPLMVRLKGFISAIFLYSIALMPFISLFREGEIGFLQVNWVLYPLVLFSLFFTIAIQSRISKLFILFLFICTLYFVKTIVSSVDLESIVRFFFSVIPLFFLDSISDIQDKSRKRNVIIVYCVAILFPIVYGILQYQGVLPFINYDYVNGQAIGRVSGGYDKPNNFTAFIFPLYLLAFLVFEKRKLLGAGLLFFILFLVYITGLRTTVAIYFTILLGYFFKNIMAKLIYNYYHYFLNFVTGIFFIISIYLTYKLFGQVDLLRGRVLTWQGHVSDFFNSKLLVIIFGKGHSTLGDYYSGPWYKGSLVEPHNNTLRIIVIFGLVGYFLYSLLMRHIVLKAFKRTSHPLNKFFVSSSFLFIMLYSFTNEPLFYPSIFWVVLFGVFFPPLQEGILKGKKIAEHR